MFSELVVAESVVVIKKLLQMQPEQHSDIIKHMAKLIDNIQVELRSKLPVFTLKQTLVLIVCVCVSGAHGPSEHPVADRRILRTRPQNRPRRPEKDGQNFNNEEDIVKLQIINLAAKLYLTNSKQVRDKRGYGQFYKRAVLLNILLLKYYIFYSSFELAFIFIFSV